MSRIAVFLLCAALMALVAAYPARAQVPAPPKTPVAEGTGGSAATVDPLATQAAIDVLRSGGNAVDAAVAAAGVLGVVEPFSCGIGGGGFMVVYDARSGKVDTFDSRETAPAGLRPDSFSQPGMAQPPAEDPRVGGLSVGVPGTVRGWQAALKRYGTRSLASLLRPAERIGDEGFVIDQTFSDQVKSNEDIFDDFEASRDLYLTPAWTAKPAGETQYNPDLARTYEQIGANPGAFYSGPIARDIVNTVQHPPKAPDADRTLPVRPGSMTTKDLAVYQAIRRKPTHIGYRGLDVFGMGPPSSGGSTVGETLNIIEGYEPLGATRTQALHHYLEGSKLAYADRNKYLGDPKYVYVPLRGLLSDGYAGERRSLIQEDSAITPPAPFGNPFPYDHGSPGKPRPKRISSGREGKSTTHMTVADRFGNVVSYTFTIEQTGGNGIVVPDRGFLLNNELTDFNFEQGTANSPAPGKRPRSSISPTIVFDGGTPAVALGSPGGSTIITTVSQILVNHIDFHQELPDALAAPRAASRNTSSIQWEPDFAADKTALETEYGHVFSATSTSEIGAATGIRFLDSGRQQAVAEPTRRGGGSAMVVQPG
jgi:gamma-glutamyltranspeptidase/glutathione hydrolase